MAVPQPVAVAARTKANAGRQRIVNRDNTGSFSESSGAGALKEKI